MMILSCSHIRKAFLTQEVLKDCTFHIEAHEKVAMVGVNGAGKTTLLRILTGDLEPDEGQIYRQRDLKIGYLPQSSDYTSTQRIEEVLLSVFDDLIRMENDMRRLEHEISRASAPQLLEEYDRLQQAFTQRDGYQYRSRVRGVLKGLGFQEAEYALPISQLSGGQRSRVALAKLLLEQPDLLLLDEPTNHLDIAAIQWLESFLAAFSGACILISHDRYFLDKLCTRTIELERGVSSEYHGNYTWYAHEKELRARQALKEYNLQQAEIKRQQGIIADLRSRGMEKFIR
ncbi:MAG: ABC-F family ATP-binding cassette domain-containing protein, partial [Firmicutes bacterium]|nr:ABC-F family ATP-binding cassette domain-containing protein [Bacillota bacterium]